MRRLFSLVTILVLLLCINGLPVKGDKTTQPPESSDSGSGLAIGLGIGGTILVILLLLALFCWWKRKKLHETTSYKRSEYIANTLRSSSEKARTPNTPNAKKKSKNPLKRMLHIKDDNTDIEGLHTEHISRENTSNRIAASAEVPGNAAAAEGAASAAACKPRGAFRSTPPQSPFKLQEPKGAAAAAGPPLPTKFQSVQLA